MIAPRPPLPFRAVNRPGRAGYVAGLQRHHLIPCALLQRRCFGPLFAALGEGALGADDFRRNGLLLPASEAGAVRMGLPLHRGPHFDYTARVADALGDIEAAWSSGRRRDSAAAGEAALEALAQLQQDLRRRLLRAAGTVRLNRRDPHRPQPDFAHLDAMAATLWDTDQSQRTPVRWASSAIAA